MKTWKNKKTWLNFHIVLIVTMCTRRCIVTMHQHCTMLALGSVHVLLCNHDTDRHYNATLVMHITTHVMLYTCKARMHGLPLGLYSGNATCLYRCLGIVREHCCSISFERDSDMSMCHTLLKWLWHTSAYLPLQIVMAH